jgi:hypothetical protein
MATIARLNSSAARRWIEGKASGCRQRGTCGVITARRARNFPERAAYSLAAPFAVDLLANYPGEAGALVGGTVTVCVTVLVLVLVETVVLVVGGVVVVVVVVVGSVVVVVVGVSEAELDSGVCVTVSVPPVGAGMTEPLDDVDAVVVLEVVVVASEPSPPVSDTMAYTIAATRMTPRAPRLTSPGAVRYHGVGVGPGGSGGGGC